MKKVLLLNADTCLLHKVHGLFKHGIKSLPIDIDQFTVDRWLTLKFVLVRIIEQWENRRAYFLEFLPKQKIFKREIKTIHCYINIKEVLEDPLL